MEYGPGGGPYDRRVISTCSSTILTRQRSHGRHRPVPFPGSDKTPTRDLSEVQSVRTSGREIGGRPSTRQRPGVKEVEIPSLVGGMGRKELSKHAFQFVLLFKRL